MLIDYSEKKEIELLEFVQKNYGMEVFTPGLERTKCIYLPIIQEIQKSKSKVTIVAGTNGKGQTAHTLAYLLEQSGLQTALWTSPHILSLRERFNFSGKNVSYEDLLNEMHAANDYLKKEYSTLKISFYEFLFLVYLRLIINRKIFIDHIILEVGLGGRLDAVNHFDGDCMCITSISRDHQAILGNRFSYILNEKIAIARSGKPLFTQFKLDYLNDLAKKYCEDHQILWRPIENIGPISESSNYFLENQALARALFQFLEPQIGGSEICGIPLFKGRREEMTFNGNGFIFIGAHNIDGVRRMIELFESEAYSDLPTQLLISFSKRPIKEVEVMLKMMVEFFGRKAKLSLTSFVHPKALELSVINDLENKFNKINKGMLDFVIDWKAELNKSKNQKTLVCGSYYFVGEVQRFIHSFS